MQAAATADYGDLIGQLTHLEQQVSSLTQSLQTKTASIEQLEKSLSDKQQRIAELEAALHIAQHSLLSLIWLKIAEYRRSLASGVDHDRLFNQLTRIDELIETARSLPVSVKNYVSMNILDTGKARLEQTKIDIFDYYRRTVESLTAHYRKTLAHLEGGLLDEAHHAFDRKIVWPVKNVRDDLSDLWQAAPDEIKFFWQEKIAYPAQRLGNTVARELRKLQIDAQATVTKITRYLKNLFNDLQNKLLQKIDQTLGGGPIGQDGPMTGTYA